MKNYLRFLPYFAILVFAVFGAAKCEAQDGTLQVFITPAGAVNAGAQWEVDAGVFTPVYNSGSVVSLAPGFHIINFRSVSGWISPNPYQVFVNIVAGSPTVVTRAYAPTGSLQVNIGPAGAVSDGAVWYLDGDTNGGGNSGGTTLSGLTTGIHVVTFKPVSYLYSYGAREVWTTPASQTVNVSQGQVTSTTGTYVLQTGSLQVTLSPSGAVAAGARWQVDGGISQSSGATITGLNPGQHILTFYSVSGWTAPVTEAVSVSSNEVTSLVRSYTPTAQTGSLQVALSPAGAVSAGAQWQVDGGAFQSNGATVSGLSTGTHTVTFNAISGWSSPVSQTVTVNANQATTTTGAYVAASQTGSLQVTLSPAGAVSAGAQWRVDGGTFQSSGATVSGLSTGSHTVTFNAVNGWTSPASQTVTVPANQTTTTIGTYVAGSQTGSLQVSLSPTGVASAGARWQVDGGPLQIDGALVNGLSSGSHTVTFNAVGGYSTPAIQNVTIIANQLTITTGVYGTSAQNEALAVTLSPPAAVSAGAQWQLDGGAFQDSGVTLRGLTSGSHTLAFKAVNGWAAPPSQSVTVFPAMPNTATGTYVASPQTGSLQVTLSPSGAVTAGVQWRVDGGAFQSSGATVGGLSTGTHTVAFNAVTGWASPASQAVTVNAGQTTYLASTYVRVTQTGPSITAVYLPGYSVSALTGVSGDGSTVVGTASSSDGSSYQGFQAGFTGAQWVPSGFGYLPSNYVSTVTAISNDTTVSAMVGFGSSYAFVYDGSPAILKTLSPLPGDNASSAQGVCAGGTSVVGTSTKIGIGGGSSQAVLWTGGTVINYQPDGTTITSPQPQGLGFLPGFNSSVAYGVCAFPTKVVGYSSNFSGYNSLDNRAFIWQPNGVQVSGQPLTGTMKDLGYPSGDTASLAVAISSDGSTVVGGSGDGQILAGGAGGAQLGTSGRMINGRCRAVYWNPDQDALIYSLNVPAGDTYSMATAISADGSFIVGSSGNYNTGYAASAMLWVKSTTSSHSHTLYNLQTLLQNAGADLTGWSNLHEATGVSSNGDVIVGYGTYNGTQKGFRVSGVLQALTGGNRKLARDLNGDGKTDLLFQNNFGQIAAWYMNGAGVNTSTVYLSTSALGDWKVKGVADLNGDSNTDIIFQNNAGQIVVWYMDGAGAKTSSGYLSTNALGDWRIVGIADMNNDGNADVIFQNNAGQLVVWYRNSSGAVTSSVYLTTIALGDWRVVGVADMNNDGNADLIFQNTTGQVFAWYMDGAGTKTASGYLNTGALGDWRVVGVADMNNDGNADLIFQNTIGQIVAWYMNGAGTKTSSGYLSIGGLGDWRVR